jgi:hypothetical protein
MNAEVQASKARNFPELIQKHIEPTNHLSVTQAEYAALSTKKERSAAKDGSYLVACTYKKPKDNRGRANAEDCCNLLFLDLDENDDGTCPAAPFTKNPDTLVKALPEYNFAAFTTASSTKDKPRMRIMVEAEGIPLDSYPDAVNTIARIIGLVSVTRESCTPNQPMILPSLFADQDPDFDHPLICSNLKGRAFTFESIQITEKAGQKARLAPLESQQVGDAADGLEYLKAPDQTASLEIVTEALGFISPDIDYHEWFSIACALRHQFCASEDETEKAYQLFDTWSATGTKYVDSDATIAKWNTIKQTPVGREPTAIRTLFSMAREAGWIDPRKECTQSQTAVSVLPYPFQHCRDTVPCLKTFDFVENLFIRGSTALVFGPSNLGKSTFALDLSAQVARGGLYRDLLQVEQGSVLYITLEGMSLFANRIEALKRDGRLPDSAPLYWASIEFNILSDEDPSRLIETINAIKAQAGAPFRLVVIDTLARAMPGADENATEAMGRVTQNAGRVQRETGACVVLVHHTGKDAARGARGAYSLKCAMDTEIELAASDDGKTVVAVTKQRDLPKIAPWAFSLRTIELGVNGRGKPVTSCVIDHQSEPLVSKSKATMFSKQKEPPSEESVFELLPEMGTIKRSLFEAESCRTLNAAGRDLTAVLDRLIADGRVVEMRVKGPSGHQEKHVSRHPSSKGFPEASTHGEKPRV